MTAELVPYQTAEVPYRALGVSTEMALFVQDVGPLGISHLVAQEMLGHEGPSVRLTEALRDLAVGSNEDRANPEPLTETKRAVLARYCGFLAGRLNLRLTEGEQDG